MKKLIKKWLGITKLEKENKSLRKTLNDYLEVSIDVHQKTPSWAVVCLKGKQECLKFYGADELTIKEIERFLRQFNRDNRVIDAPLSINSFLREVL